jgi:hypothetical protein
MGVNFGTIGLNLEYLLEFKGSVKYLGDEGVLFFLL